MDASTATLVQLLGSAGVGGVLTLAGVYFTNRSSGKQLEIRIAHESSKIQENLLRERGEELYELVDIWLSGIGNNYLSLMFVMQGKLTYNEHYDNVIKFGKGRELNFGRIKMLVDVYFPSVEGVYDKALNARSRLNDIDTQHRRAYDQGDTDGERFLRPYVSAQENLEAAGELLKNEVAQVIRSI